MDTLSAVISHMHTNTNHAALLVESLTLAEPVIAQASRLDPAVETPCEDMNRGTLLAHLNAVSARILAIGQGTDVGLVPSEISAADYVAAVRDRVEPIAIAWDALSADDTVVVPWGRLIVADAAGMYAAEVLVHAWDLASSGGITFEISSALADATIAAYRKEMPDVGRAEGFQAIRDAMPPEAPGFKDPFADAVEVGPDATPIQRLVAMSGRRP